MLAEGWMSTRQCLWLLALASLILSPSSWICCSIGKQNRATRQWRLHGVSVIQVGRTSDRWIFCMICLTACTQLLFSTRFKIDEVQWFQEELELILDAARGFHESEKDKEDIELISSESPEVQIRLNIYYSTLSFEDQESIVVAAPPMASPAPGRLVLANSTSNSTTATAVTSLNVPFSGDNRVVWIRERLDVGGYIRSQIEEVPEEQTVEIVGCGPPLMLAQLHNAVAANEQLSGCRVDLRTERFYM